MTPRSPASRPARVDGVDEVAVDDGLLLHYRGALFRMSPVGAVLWHCLDGTVTVAELRDDMSAVLPETVDTAAALAGFVAALRKHGLVT